MRTESGYLLDGQRIEIDVAWMVGYRDRLSARVVDHELLGIETRAQSENFVTV